MTGCGASWSERRWLDTDSAGGADARNVFGPSAAIGGGGGWHEKTTLEGEGPTRWMADLRERQDGSQV